MLYDYLHASSLRGHLCPPWARGSAWRWAKTDTSVHHKTLRIRSAGPELVYRHPNLGAAPPPEPHRGRGRGTAILSNFSFLLGFRPHQWCRIAAFRHPGRQKSKYLPAPLVCRAGPTCRVLQLIRDATSRVVSRLVGAVCSCPGGRSRVAQQCSLSLRGAAAKKPKRARRRTEAARTLRKSRRASTS